MAQRTHVPFDSFAMQVEVPVSQLVRDGDLAWSCGQCPLDLEGGVLCPGDLLAQADVVCDAIETLMGRGGLDGRAIGKLVVYYLAATAEEGDALIGRLRRRFPHRPLIVPVPVPHFYYEGMLIEVDVFAGPPATPLDVASDPDTGVLVDAVTCGDLIWASVRADISSDLSVERCRARLPSTLAARGLRPSLLLSDRWFATPGSADVTKQTLLDLASLGLITDPAATVTVEGSASGTLSGELTFTRDIVEHRSESTGDTGVTTHRRRAGPLLWVSGISAAAGTDLVGQTRSIMDALERALEAERMSFANVAKLTTHYCGDASAEDLHGNMTVRHSYYAEPGPASTGVPVKALHSPHSRIAIDAVAVA